MKNFHVPLPDDTYNQLRLAAARSKIPATALAREAIDFWLRQQMRQARHDAIAAFAVDAAGTTLDLDRDWEAAGIAQLAPKPEAADEHGSTRIEKKCLIGVHPR